MRTPGDELFDRINAIVMAELEKTGASALTVERAIEIAMRELRPFVRNRFSIVNASTPDDMRHGRLRLAMLDYADGRQCSADDLVYHYRVLGEPLAA